MFFCLLESLKSSYLKFVAVFIPLYFAIIYFSFLLVRKMLLPCNVVLQVFKVFSVNDYHVYQA